MLYTENDIDKNMASHQTLKSKIARGLMAVGTIATLAPSAFAVAAIENNTLEGLPSVGSDLGEFLTNLAPGIGAFVLILGIFLGVVAIIYGVAAMVAKLAGRGFKK